MVPKKYFEKNRQPIEQNYIFGLMTEECKNRFNDHIKKPIEAITQGIRYESAFDIDEPGEIDLMDRIWKRIQKAGIIIVDVTGFQPNVMYELGVVLTIKEDVIIICDEEVKNMKEIPFNISHLNIIFYNSNNMAALGTKLVQSITKVLKEMSIIFQPPEFGNPETVNIMKTVKNLRKKKEWDSALALFERMKNLESENCEVYKQWGITFKFKGDFENAFKMLDQASALATNNFQRSQIFTEIALLHEKLGKDTEALNFFRKAEEADNSNDKLYRSWALYHLHKDQFNEALPKMSLALEIYRNNKKKDKSINKYDFTLKRDQATLEYITKKLIEPTFPMTLGEFLNSKRIGKNDMDEESLNISIKKGDVFDGTIQNVHLNFGLFVDIDDRRDTGLVLRKFLPDNYSQKYQKGDSIKVEVVDVKSNGNIDLKIVN